MSKMTYRFNLMNQARDCMDGLVLSLMRLGLMDDAATDQSNAILKDIETYAFRYVCIPEHLQGPEDGEPFVEWPYEENEYDRGECVEKSQLVDIDLGEVKCR